MMIRKAIIPAAGLGTRMLPATKAIPKELLTIVDKPVIQYVVEEAIASGITDILIVISKNKTALQNHFAKEFPNEDFYTAKGKVEVLEKLRAIGGNCKIEYIEQEELEGLGDAIYYGKAFVDNEPFAVLLADDFCVHDDGAGVLKQMVALYEKHQCSIVAIEEIPRDQTENYGVVAGKEIDEGIYQIEAMVEKPKPEDAPSNLAIIGRYILTPDIFQIIRDTPPGRGGEVQITDAIATQAKNGKVLAYKFKGNRFDCGRIDGFVQATNYVYENYYSQGGNYPDLQA